MEDHSHMGHGGHGDMDTGGPMCNMNVSETPTMNPIPRNVALHPGDLSSRR